MYNKKSDINT